MSNELNKTSYFNRNILGRVGENYIAIGLTVSENQRVTAKPALTEFFFGDPHIPSSVNGYFIHLMPAIQLKAVNLNSLMVPPSHCRYCT